MNRRELLHKAEGTLTEAGVPDAAWDAWELFEFCTGLTRTSYYIEPESPVEDNAAARYMELVEKRACRIPLQHILGKAYFMGYPFVSDGRTLIPRQDTETVVENALGLLPKDRPAGILDLCTGSGCILLSILLERPEDVGTGTDISAEALSAARQNAEQLGVMERCVFREGDLFSALPSPAPAERDPFGPPYDLIISNPPYIPSGVIRTLSPEVRCHDPLIALDGKEDGLFFYRRIVAEASAWLCSGGFLVFEIGHDQGETVRSLMQEAGFIHTEVRQDLNGLDRTVLGQKIGEMKDV